MSPGDGQEQHLFVAQALGDLVDRVIGEGDARVLSLHAVDGVAEDPPATAEALAVAALLAVATTPASAHARQQHAVALGDGGDACANLQDGPDCLVAENRAWDRLGHVALEDV